MIQFLIAAALLVTATLALLARPWWRRTRTGAASRQTLNAAIYRDELADLERDRSSGQLSETDYGQARAELQRRLLEDATEPDVPLAPTAHGRRTLVGLIIALPLAAAGFYTWLGSPHALDQTVQPQGAMTPEDINRMVATLAAKLEKEPDNLQGWAMLARSYKVMHRPEEAIRAFEKAKTFVEQDPDLLTDYADLLASTSGGNLDGQPEQLVNMALKLDPNHMQSLWLAGTAAFNRKDYGKAAETWEKALAQLPPESEDAKMLSNIIGEARDKQGAKKTAAAAPTAAISGRVELAENLKAQAAPTDTVFILARGDDGPMPLAVLRVRVAELPMDFRLDDSNAIAPTRTLSSAKSVRIEARVAKSGEAKTKPGDLSGTAGPVKPGAKDVRIKIDTVVK
jgi:cytochrome c-type biogenesis protein CcmH